MLIHSTSNPKVAEKNSTLVGIIRVGYQNVGGLDVTVQESLPMCVVQCGCHRRDDLADQLCGHSVRISVRQSRCNVLAIDIFHRNPQAALKFPSVEYTDDMGMPQSTDKIGFAHEAVPEGGVRLGAGGEQFQCIAPGKSRVLYQIDLTHSAGPKSSHDGISGKNLTRPQRHFRIVPKVLELSG